MTGSAARELSLPRGCLPYAVAAAIRDTLTPTPGQGRLEPGGTTLIRIRLSLSVMLGTLLCIRSRLIFLKNDDYNITSFTDG